MYEKYQIIVSLFLAEKICKQNDVGKNWNCFCNKEVCFGLEVL